MNRTKTALSFAVLLCLLMCGCGRDASQLTVVTGIGVDGSDVTVRLLPSVKGSDLVYETTVPVFQIRDVVLHEATDDYVTLYAKPVRGEAEPRVLARYHPKEKVPVFHRYRIPRFHDGPYDILAEVQIDPWPLVADEDVIPFPTLEPIKCMMLAQWNQQNNETATAEKFEKQAMQWLTRFNAKKNIIQTATVVNVPYNGSMGELSSWCVGL